MVDSLACGQPSRVGVRNCWLLLPWGHSVTLRRILAPADLSGAVVAYAHDLRRLRRWLLLSHARCRAGQPGDQRNDRGLKQFAQQLSASCRTPEPSSWGFHGWCSFRIAAKFVL